MRIGVAGVGRIGTMHAANLAALATVDEVLLFDPVPGRAAAAAATLAAGPIGSGRADAGPVADTAARPADGARADAGPVADTAARPADGARADAGPVADTAARPAAEPRADAGPVAGAAGRPAAEPHAGADPVAGAAVRPVDSVDELLRQSDGVLVATPTDTHPVLVRRCLAARIPVLCEKPIAPDLAEMSALADDIEAAGVPVLVGFQRRFDPPMVALRRRILAGELGQIYHVRATGFDAQPPDLGYLPSSGGIFRDLLIHDLDAIPWLLGEPVVEVYASGSVLVDPAFAAADDVDNAVVVLRFAGGAHAVLTAGRHDPLGYDHRVEVLGAHDSVSVGLDARTPLRPMGGLDAYQGFPERFEHAYRNEMRVFVEVLGGRAENPSPARDSLVSLRLAEACEQSRRSGQPVRTPEWSRS